MVLQLMTINSHEILLIFARWLLVLCNYFFIFLNVFQLYYLYLSSLVSHTTEWVQLPWLSTWTEMCFINTVTFIAFELSKTTVSDWCFFFTWALYTMKSTGLSAAVFATHHL